MPKSRQTVAAEQEPIGIIISRGRIVEPSPRVTAFVWGIGDEPEEETEAPKPA